MTKARSELGSEGEALAAEYLEDRGFRILDRNYRTPLGEIDLVAKKDDALHFIEVKTRRGTTAGGPFDQVTLRKQRQIIRTALAYCRHKRLHNFEYHFSVLGIQQTDGAATCDFLEDAFEVPEGMPYV